MTKAEAACRRCTLPAGFPNLRLNDKGLCQHCVAYLESKPKLILLKRELRERFTRTLNAVRGKSDYDVLLCLSGGKDSCYALKIFAQDLGLRTLAYTVDNGFLPPQAFENIRRMVHRLGADHLCFKPDPHFINRLFSAALESDDFTQKTIERGSLVCASCISIVKYSAIQTAVQKKIPLIGFGWTPGQSLLDAAFLQLNPMMLKSFQESAQSFLKHLTGDASASERFFLHDPALLSPETTPYLVHPAAFWVRYDEKRILRWLHSSGWKRPGGLDAHSSNCRMNSFAVSNHLRRFGFHPYHAETAKLIREGYLTREEGLRRLRRKVPSATVREVRRILSKRGARP